MQKVKFKKIILSLSCITFLAVPLMALKLNENSVVFYDIKNINSKKVRSFNQNYKVMLIKTVSPLNQKEINSFYKEGAKAIVYAGDLSYFVYAKSSKIAPLIKKLSSKYSKIVSYADMKSEYKISNSLKQKAQNLFAGDLVDVNLLFFVEFSKDELKSYLHNIDLEILSQNQTLKSAKVRLSIEQINKLAQLEAIQFIDLSVNDLSISGTVKKTRNLQTAKHTDVTTLWGNGYNLSGKGIRVGIVDGGKVLTTHQELSGRVFIEGDNYKTNRHSTHVAGTIGAKGVDESARGMANGVSIYSYSFLDVAFADSVATMYSKRSILLSNHSYGYSDKVKLAEYDEEARKQDQLVRSNPYINIFQAAGNDGSESSYPDFGFIKGPANSKNIFTIGALDSSSSDVATLSSKGPVRDGRIKPDLVVRGEYVKSTDSLTNNSYIWMSGTSMATPAATGIAALLSEAYKNITGDDIRHDTLKSILINSAIDKANKGPDYKAGFGMIDAKAAADVIKTLTTSNPLVIESKVKNEEVKVYSFSLENATDFKTTISWVDPAPNPSSYKTLVNDIDIWLENKTTGKIYYPYSLSKDSPNALATANSFNRVDNIEQIEVKNLPSGEYSLFVKGYEIIEGNSQEYAIVSNINIFNTNSDFLKKESLIRNFARILYLSD